MTSLDQETGSIDLDLTWNRINLALARSQRLVATWLPPDTSKGDKQAGTSDGDKSSTARGASLEDNPFETTSEKTGYGYIPPNDLAGTSSHLPALNSTDRLRGLLLPGTKKGRSGKGSGGSGTIVGIAGVLAPVVSIPKASTPQTHRPGQRGTHNSTTTRSISDDGSDEEGEQAQSRSQLGRAKKKTTLLQDRTKKSPEPGGSATNADQDGDADGDADGDIDGDDDDGASKGLKRPNRDLDEGEIGAEAETAEHLNTSALKIPTTDNNTTARPPPPPPKRSGYQPPPSSSSSLVKQQQQPQPTKKAAARSYLDEVLQEREAKRRKKEEKKRRRAGGEGA